MIFSIIFCCYKEAFNYLLDIINYQLHYEAQVNDTSGGGIVPGSSSSMTDEIIAPNLSVSIFWLLATVTYSGRTGFSQLLSRKVSL